MPDLRTVLTDAIVAALREQLEVDHVDNGLTFLRQGNGTVAVDTDALADALLGLRGVAVTQLPEPDEDGNFWWSRNYVFVDGDGLIVTKYGTTFGDADDVREVAAAFLGAAAAAVVLSEGETR